MKQKKGTLARRDFMIATAAAGSAILSGCFSSHNSGWETLTDADAATLKAVCDQIIPADDFPSASDAGSRATTAVTARPMLPASSRLTASAASASAPRSRTSHRSSS